MKLAVTIAGAGVYLAGFYSDYLLVTIAGAIVAVVSHYYWPTRDRRDRCRPHT